MTTPSLPVRRATIDDLQKLTPLWEQQGLPAAELGTPFNAEIERLQQLVAIASREGVLVGLKTETGRITQDPDTAVVLCDNVKGLGITLDPTHYIYGPHAGGKGYRRSKREQSGNVSTGHRSTLLGIELVTGESISRGEACDLAHPHEDVMEIGRSYAARTSRPPGVAR